MCVRQNCKSAPSNETIFPKQFSLLVVLTNVQKYTHPHHIQDSAASVGLLQGGPKPDKSSRNPLSRHLTEADA